MGKIILETRGLRKTFGSFVANDAIDLQVESGCIHAIAGENGAGKSTLMKMLYGVYRPDGGQLLIDGEEMRDYGPSEARRRGIGMVFQDFRLVPAFTVLENVFLSAQEEGFLLKKAELRKKIRALSETYHLHADPDAPVWRLDLGQRQHVEILKVLLHEDTRLLIFDEPTSVLAPHEAEAFLRLLVRLKERGYAVLLITHKIKEILQVADRVSILRKGVLVHTFPGREGLTEQAIVSKMLGDDSADIRLGGYRGEGEAVQRWKKPLFYGSELTIQDDHRRNILYKSFFAVCSGEILGVAGISGNGQREFAEALYGVRPLAYGNLYLDGQAVNGETTRQRLDRGIQILSEDPIRDNVIPGFTILEHMALLGLSPGRRGLNYDWQDLRRQFDGRPEMEELGVPAPERLAEKLSGGNIQRMVFARAVAAGPKVLIASYPSRGLDIVTVRAVHHTLLRLKEQGAAVILISEDLNELFSLSDRLVVLADSYIFGPYLPYEYDPMRIGKIMLKGARNT